MHRIWRSGLAAIIVALVAVPAAGALAQATLDGLYQDTKAAGERQVVVYGPPSAELRTELSKAFSSRFPDVELVYSGMTGSQAFSKISTERKAGLSTVDVVISGASTITRNLKGAKLVQPIDRFLKLPEVTDPKRWMGGVLPFADAEHMMFAMTSLIELPVVVNKDMVKPGELTRDQDLMDPKWKGKIVSGDPGRPGAAHYAWRRLWDLHGEAWVRRLITEQNVTFVADLRQLVDMVAKGRYPVALGVDPTTVNDMISRGANTLRLDDNLEWKDRKTNSTGFGGVAVMDKPPHPAATALFVNWLLTDEGQMPLASGLFYGTRRIGVAIPLPAVMQADPKVTYFEAYVDSYIRDPATQKVIQMMKEMGGGR